MTSLSLFSGIGGLALAAEWAGFEPVAFVECEPFCRRVLAKHWPSVPQFDDVRTLDATQFRGVDLIEGGFPCQDISVAGAGAGLDGERSGLWFEMLRIIRESRPRFVVAENVSALLHRGIDVVLCGLEEAGYTVDAVCVGADDVGAPHKRSRWFIVGEMANADRDGQLQPQGRFSNFGGWAEYSSRRHAKPSMGGAANGIPGRVDSARRLDWPAGRGGVQKHWEAPRTVPANSTPDRGARIKALGNAVSPQQAYPIMAAIAQRMGAA